MNRIRKLLSFLFGITYIYTIDTDGEIRVRHLKTYGEDLACRGLDGSILIFPDGTTAISYIKTWKYLFPKNKREE